MSAITFTKKYIIRVPTDLTNYFSMTISLPDLEFVAFCGKQWKMQTF